MVRASKGSDATAADDSSNASPVQISSEVAHAIAETREVLARAKRVLVFTGAGVSAESGIATFRDALTGLWARFDAASLATPEAFARDPSLVWGWYEWRRARVMHARPNDAHAAIALLQQRAGCEVTLVTQNVDDLHERAGSTVHAHLHGSLFAPRCARCGHAYRFGPTRPDVPDDGRRMDPPRCEACNGPVRPGVVWFGEPLDTAALELAFERARTCDVVLSIGTSSLVQPAAMIPVEAAKRGAKVVQVNPHATALDGVCAVNVRAAAGVAMTGMVGER